MISDHGWKQWYKSNTCKRILKRVAKKYGMTISELRTFLGISEE